MNQIVCATMYACALYETCERDAFLSLDCEHTCFCTCMRACSSRRVCVVGVAYSGGAGGGLWCSWVGKREIVAVDVNVRRGWVIFADVFGTFLCKLMVPDALHFDFVFFVGDHVLALWRVEQNDWREGIYACVRVRLYMCMCVFVIGIWFFQILQWTNRFCDCLLVILLSVCGCTSWRFNFFCAQHCGILHRCLHQNFCESSDEFVNERDGELSLSSHLIWAESLYSASDTQIAWSVHFSAIDGWSCICLDFFEQLKRLTSSHYMYPITQSMNCRGMSSWSGGCSVLTIEVDDKL